VTGSWLHRFAVLTAAATLGLVALGGLVTSHGVGMAVPDWPNTYGYNMFFFPISKWVGGVFYEHSHRLWASGVGLLTTVLALWFYGTSVRPFLRIAGMVLCLLGLGLGWLASSRWADAVIVAVTGVLAFGASFVWPCCEPSPKWLRRLGILAFLVVVLQGVLGGLRVVLFKDQIGVFHATLAQLFFVLMCALAIFTSPWWQAAVAGAPHASGSSVSAFAGNVPRGFHWLFSGATLLILCQLILGATMRHQHAGLAIPDFPLAYGKLWPAMDPASVAHYNQQRMEVIAVNPITGLQVGLQMAHRLLALLILIAVSFCAWRTRRTVGAPDTVAKLALLWLELILVQVLAGAATVWSNKAADVATLHVVIGALSLAMGAILSLIAYERKEAPLGMRGGIAPQPGPSVPIGARPSRAVGLD